MGSDTAKAHASYKVQPAMPAGVLDAPVDDIPSPLAGDEPVADASAAVADPTATAADSASFRHTGVVGGDPLTEMPQPCPDSAVGEDIDPLIPVPQSAPIGAPLGVALLIGGADLVDSAATLVAYRDGESCREVLHAVVTPEAEAKLLDAIWLGKQQLVPVTVTKEVHGRLPVDNDKQLFDQAQKLAKSINHHLSQQDGMPAHTVAGHEQLTAHLDELEGGQMTSVEAQMVAHYRSVADAMTVRLAADYSVPYESGGKLALVTPFEVASSVEVTVMVPAPIADLPPGRAAAYLREASRIAPTLDPVGTVAWDGSSRAKSSGTEYVIDLGDGFEAVYRPHAAPPGKTAPAYSHRGTLEIVAPAGAGRVHQLVDKLAGLHLVNRAMSQAEGEWAYLQRNIWAQALDSHPEVATALQTATGLENAALEELWGRRADEAIGMNEPQLIAFGKRLMIEAEAKSLVHKVAVLRDGVAKAKGLASGAELLALPEYDATPSRSGGWLEWRRFDVNASETKVDTAFGKKGLVHRTSVDSIAAMILNGGALACTERRRIMGVAAGVGWSEDSDMRTGGALAVFCRVESEPAQGTAAIFWAQPSRLLVRADWYAYPHDTYGATNPESGKNMAAMTRDPLQIAQWNGSNNEVMFRNGIDLLGPQAPTRIRAGSKEGRQKILTALAARGVTHLNDVPVEEVVQQ